MINLCCKIPTFILNKFITIIKKLAIYNGANNNYLALGAGVLLDHEHMGNEKSNALFYKASSKLVKMMLYEKLSAHTKNFLHKNMFLNEIIKLIISLFLLR